MGFGQLFYTSCEHGLTKYPGYQFNAATPGIPPEVMTDVEAMTAYDPPPSLAYDANAEQIASCPVNLCYRPGPYTVLANVVFVGTDYSHRFGNYFAHALITDNPDVDLGAVLPIELWRAPFWVSQPVAEPELPRLSLPPIDRLPVADFIGEHRGREHLTALLTAVGEAVIRKSRKVVIIEQDTESVAKWIATVSYLLPVELVRRMSFATYENQPRYSGLNVIGTLPDSDFVSDETAVDNYFLFDFKADRVSSIDVHPLAELLTDIGVESAGDAWRRATELADGTEQTLDDWHPVLAAAITSPSLLTPANAAAVAGWLAHHARRLGQAAVAEIGRRMIAAAATDPTAHDSLIALRKASDAVAAHDLAEDVEQAFVDVLFREVFPSGIPLDGVPLLRSASARAQATAALNRELEGMRPDVVIGVLDWARRSELDISPDALRQVGARVLGPAVIGTAGSGSALLGQRSGDKVESLLRNWPPLGHGVLDYLVEIEPTQFNQVVEVLLGPVGEVTDVHQERTLGAAAAVAAALAGRTTRLEALQLVETVRPEILESLWPDGRWSHREAKEALQSVPFENFAAPQVIDWLAATLRTPPADGDESEDYDELCLFLTQHPAVDQLPTSISDQVLVRHEAALVVDGLMRATARSEFNNMLTQLRKRNGDGARRLKQVVAGKLFERSGALPVAKFPAHRLARIIVEIEEFRQAYLNYISSLARGPAQPDRMARVLFVVTMVDVMNRHKTAIELRRPALNVCRKWRRKDLRTTAKLIRARRSASGEPHWADVADWFEQWCQEHTGNSLVRIARSWITPTERP